MIRCVAAGPVVWGGPWPVVEGGPALRLSRGAAHAGISGDLAHRTVQHSAVLQLARPGWILVVVAGAVDEGDLRPRRVEIAAQPP